jgi:plasmid stabilization system protein ParE
MTLRKYRFSRQAQNDLAEIADYLSERSARAADRVLDAFLMTFERLAENPWMGMNRADLHPGLRMFVPRRRADSFVIFYYPLSDGIEVSDVVHASQDWLGMYERGERWRYPRPRPQVSQDRRGDLRRTSAALTGQLALRP